MALLWVQIISVTSRWYIGFHTPVGGENNHSVILLPCTLINLFDISPTSLPFPGWFSVKLEGKREFFPLVSTHLMHRVMGMKLPLQKLWQWEESNIAESILLLNSQAVFAHSLSKTLASEFLGKWVWETSPVLLLSWPCDC